jgi:hypothetical protein
MTFLNKNSMHGIDADEDENEELEEENVKPYMYEVEDDNQTNKDEKNPVRRDEDENESEKIEEEDLVSPCIKVV